MNNLLIINNDLQGVIIIRFCLFLLHHVNRSYRAHNQVCDDYFCIKNYLKTISCEKRYILFYNIRFKQ